MIEPKSKLGSEMMVAPIMPRARASTSLPPILSFKKNLDKTATKTGPREERRPAKLEETIVSAKLSDKWYMGTIKTATVKSLGKSFLSNSIFGLQTSGANARKHALATSHLSKAKLTGESSATTLRIATNANPQKTLRTARKPYLMTCRQILPSPFSSCETVDPTLALFLIPFGDKYVGSYLITCRAIYREVKHKYVCSLKILRTKVLYQVKGRLCLMWLGMPLKLDAELLFGIHDDIRHIVVADLLGNVQNIFSRAKKTLPEDMQKETVGVISSVAFSLGEKVREVAGDVECVVVYHEKLKVIILKSEKNLYVITARKSLPEEAVYKLISLAKGEG